MAENEEETVEQGGDGFKPRGGSRTSWIKRDSGEAIQKWSLPKPRLVGGYVSPTVGLGRQGLNILLFLGSKRSGQFTKYRQKCIYNYYHLLSILLKSADVESRDRGSCRTSRTVCTVLYRTVPYRSMPFGVIRSWPVHLQCSSIISFHSRPLDTSLHSHPASADR